MNFIQIETAKKGRGRGLCQLINRQVRGVRRRDGPSNGTERERFI
jgi:hypothetical protein